jgi:hypothetical protein
MSADGRRHCGGNFPTICRANARKPSDNFPAFARSLPGSFAGNSAETVAEVTPIIRRTSRRLAAGNPAAIAPDFRRQIGGGEILVRTRSKAWTLLNMMRNGLVPLLN